MSGSPQAGQVQVTATQRASPDPAVILPHSWWPSRCSDAKTADAVRVGSALSDKYDLR